MIEANILLAPKVGQFACIIDDVQRDLTEEEFDLIIKFLKDKKDTMYPVVKIQDYRPGSYSVSLNGDMANEFNGMYEDEEY